tara:strand:- start:29319 stop:30956 length:1638 start_codon:yes stop_codon:yes gene_type:complete
MTIQQLRKLVKSPDNTYLSLAAVLMFTFLLYYPSLSYEFLGSLDDAWLITENDAIKNLSFEGVRYLFFGDDVDFHYYPLTYLSLSIDYYFFGLHSYYYNLHNLLLHMISGGLLFYLINLIYKNKNIALLTTAMFLLCSINIESVAWTSCRRQTLSLCYVLISLIFYFRFVITEKKILFFAAILFWIFSLLSKSSFIVVPAIFLFFFYSNKSLKGNWLALICQVAIFILIDFIFIKINLDIDETRNFLKRDFSYTLFEHIAMIFYSINFYWFKFFYTLNQSFFYPAPSENLNFLPKEYYLSIISGSMFILSSIYLFIKKKYKLFFPLFFYLVFLSPYFNLMFFPLGDLPMLVTDRYFYHAGIGVLLTISILIVRMENKFAQRVIIFILFSSQLYYFSKYIPHWKTESSLYEFSMKNHPSEEFLQRMGVMYYGLKMPKKASLAFERAEKLDTDIWINSDPYSYFEKSLVFLYMNDCKGFAKCYTLLESKVQDNCFMYAYEQVLKKQEVICLDSIEVGFKNVSDVCDEVEIAKISSTIENLLFLEDEK